MRPGSRWLVGVVAMALEMGAGAASAWAESGTAIIGSTGEPKVLGSAAFTELDDGLEVDVQLIDVPPGRHGLHLHQYGDCGDVGNAAGGHFNPDEVPHGFLPKDGLSNAHPGDMGNIEVGRDRTGTLRVVLPGVSLGGEYSVGGRSIVLHEQADDFGQPTGNAGGRIGCGVILIVAPMAEEPAP
ncbi:MAG: superoxide dismutase family protein [Candidatus Omnitrophica bacterium]|nr:superoxide dismutase family protein [Candidatus Omnitrophota bacterium]